MSWQRQPPGVGDGGPVEKGNWLHAVISGARGHTGKAQPPSSPLSPADPGQTPPASSTGRSGPSRVPVAVLPPALRVPVSITVHVVSEPGGRRESVLGQNQGAGERVC